MGSAALMARGTRRPSVVEPHSAGSPLPRSLQRVGRRSPGSAWVGPESTTISSKGAVADEASTARATGRISIGTPEPVAAAGLEKAIVESVTSPCGPIRPRRTASPSSMAILGRAGLTAKMSRKV